MERPGYYLRSERCSYAGQELPALSSVARMTTIPVAGLRIDAKATVTPRPELVACGLENVVLPSRCIAGKGSSCLLARQFLCRHSILLGASEERGVAVRVLRYRRAFRALGYGCNVARQTCSTGNANTWPMPRSV